MLEHCVAKAMTNDIGRSAAGRQWCGRPELSGLLIANIESLSSAVKDRIIAPWSQSEFMRVLNPGVGGTALRNNRPEVGIGQHIDPWRRSHLSRLEGDDILVTVGRKAAKTVLEDKLPRRDLIR